MIDKLAKFIKGSMKIVFFGGAGVSTESGIPDFRSSNGIYNIYRDMRPEEIISKSYFESNPESFYKFYREKMIFGDVEPNYTHIYLAELEKSGKDITIVTQNIDALHQKAGSVNVLELHGSIYRNYCLDCGLKFGIDRIISSEQVPKCECGGIIRPDVTLYEESLDEEVLFRSIEAISSCDFLIVGGTSLTVYPAAALVRYYRGREMAIINQSSTPYDSSASILIREKIGETFKKVSEIINNQSR